MNRALILIGIAFANAARGIRQASTTTLLAVLTIAVVLVLIGSAWLLVGNMAGLLDEFGGELKLTAYLDADLPVISADPGRLRQVLHNLLLNAREALTATPKPMISVSTRVLTENTHRFAELKIQDNGPGFPEAQLVRLYEPYVTSKPKGTGLGLAIVKKIVEEHGGRVEADNRPEGGARVRVSLPVTDGTRQLMARERRAEPRKERA